MDIYRSRDIEIFTGREIWRHICIIQRYIFGQIYLGKIWRYIYKEKYGDIQEKKYEYIYRR